MPIPEVVLKCVALFINVQVAVPADPYFDFFFLIPVIILFFPALFTNSEFLLVYRMAPEQNYSTLLAAI